jgi:nicotinate-nucleotide adenylyltransferase
MIGVFGGTFDPIHFGHLQPAHEVCKALEFCELRFITAAVPPHRSAPIASPAQRLDMVRCALEDYPEFVVDDRELRRSESDGRPSYTVDTLGSLKEDCQSKTLCLLVGADAFLSLDTWHRWQEILELAHLVVMQRPGWTEHTDQDGLPVWAKDCLCESPSALAQQKAGLVRLQPVTPVDISGSHIRSQLVQGKSVDKLLPVTVRNYIERNHLYQA